MFLCFCFFVFCLYVGVAVLILPLVWLGGKLRFGVATQFSARFGVGIAFFSTRDMWLHAGAVSVWMWKHVSTVLVA
jgi:hypothetical protein